MAPHKHDIISSAIATHLRSSRKHLVNFEIDKDPEHLHQLRIEIKKVRAILSFTAFAFHKKIDSKYLDPLFRKAGSIRVYEIVLAHPDLQAAAPVELIDNLIHTKQLLQEKFIEKIQQYEKDIKSFLNNIHLDFSFPDSSIIAGYFLSRKIDAVDKFNTHQREDLHQFRKIIKDLKYVYEFIPKAEQQKIFLDIKLIDKLQKDVGEWHDTVSTLQLLSHINFPGTEHCTDVLSQKELLQLAALKANYSDLNL